MKCRTDDFVTRPVYNSFNFASLASLLVGSNTLFLDDRLLLIADARLLIAPTCVCYTFCSAKFGFCRRQVSNRVNESMKETANYFDLSSM
jgi:hypothetical protein